MSEKYITEMSEEELAEWPIEDKDNIGLAIKWLIDDAFSELI